MKKCMYMIFIGILTISMTACSTGDNKGLSNTKEPASEALSNTKKPVSKEGKTVVTMAMSGSLEPSNYFVQSGAYGFFQTVEKKFEEKYPEIDLEFQFTEDNQKYKTTTNTALLSGKGPDIFEISSLPIEDYVSKKLLLNMDGAIEQDKTLNKNDLQTNILDVLKRSGSLYAMPLGFNLRVFAGDGDILKNTNVDDKKWTWKDFENTVKKLGEGGKERRYGLAFYPAESVFIDLVVGRYSEFVDISTKTAKIDSPVFVGLMNQVKKMYDDKIMTGDEGASIFYSSNGISKPEGLMSLYEIFSNPKLLQQPEQTGGARVSSASQFAVQANSSVKEEAWKVIAFLLSDEVQSLPGRTGFSLLKSVNEKQLNEIQKQVKSGTYKLSSGKVPKVSDVQFTQFKQMIDTARSYQSPDMEVYAILNAEVSSFFNGQKSAEEVAKLIQNKVTTFLNE